MIVDETAHDGPAAAGREPESNWPDAMSWRAASVCRKHPTHWWFAGGHRETVTAKRICGGCAVKAPCLEFALSRPELLGVWAATTPVERATMRKLGSEPATEVAVAGTADVDLSALSPAVAVGAELRRAGMRRKLERDPGIDAGAPRVRSRGDRPSRMEVAVERDELLTPAEAARKLGVTPNTVTRWSRAGKISAIQTMGGHRRFRRSEIERVLRDGSTVASQPTRL